MNVTSSVFFCVYCVFHVYKQHKLYVHVEKSELLAEEILQSQSEKWENMHIILYHMIYIIL